MYTFDLTRLKKYGMCDDCNCEMLCCLSNALFTLTTFFVFFVFAVDA